ncbi:isochorismatase family protein, partial [Halobellus sp. Atlit-31R]
MQRDHPALLIIDMQQCMARLDAGARNNPQAEANVDLLLEAWRGRRAPVVHVRHI